MRARAAVEVVPSLLVALACIACQAHAELGTPCLRSSDCPAPLVCGQGRCRVACRTNRDCGVGQRCFLAQDGTGTCSLDSENGCATTPADDVCACDLSCHEDQCVARCTTASDCPSDGVCRAALGSTTTFCFATPAADAGSPGSDASASCGAGAVCAEAVPAGWSGPVQMYQGATVPPCPALTTMAIDGNGGLVAPNAACSPCTCGPLTAPVCSDPMATLFNDPVCGATPCASRSIGPTCGPLKMMTECSASASVYMNFVSTVTSGSCMPSAQTPTVTPWTWSTRIRACTPMAAGMACGSGGACAQAPMGASVCVYQSGDVPCPGGAYATRTVAYTGVAESRSCSPCGCGISGLTCSGGTVIVSDFGICTGGTPSAVPSVCTTDPFAAANAFVAQVTVPATAPANCNVVQSQPINAAVPTGATTICCR